MIDFLIITGKTGLALAVFYLFYRYMLSKDKLFGRNRYYLLGASVLSFVLPWISIPLAGTESPILSIAYIGGGSHLDNQGVRSEISAFPWTNLITLIYLLGVAVFFVKTILSYFQVYRIIINALHIPFDKFKIVTTPCNLSPFSFLKWIVIPSHINPSHPSYEKMVQHEMVHCRQYHSVDLLIGELLVAFQWFNPFAWFLRKSVSENLEYLVDEEMLKTGTNAKDYQYSLLSFSMVGLKPAVANNFNTNLLKKRIVMMNKRKYPGKYWFHNLLMPVCMVLALVLTASFRKQLKPENMPIYQQYVKSERNTNDPQGLSVKEQSGQIKDADVLSAIQGQSNLEESAEISGFSYNEGKEVFLRYVAQNIKYPQIANENNVSGIVKVLVTFNPGNIQVKDFVKGSGVPEFEEVVVVGYGGQGNKQNSGTINDETDFLRKEVDRVIKNFIDIPKDLKGKTFAVSVKFQIHGTDVVGYGNETKDPINPNVKVLIRSTDVNATKEPYYVLNDEKLISKAEMELIDPKSIESVEVIKANRVEHKKLGIIDGNVVIINTKK